MPQNFLWSYVFRYCVYKTKKYALIGGDTSNNEISGKFMQIREAFQIRNDDYIKCQHAKHYLASKQGSFEAQYPI